MVGRRLRDHRTLRKGAVIMTDSSEPAREEKIADALRAAPAFIADSATVVDWDMTTVLREGSPDWICVPTPQEPRSGLRTSGGRIT
jgi:hypothetical protein